MTAEAKPRTKPRAKPKAKPMTNGALQDAALKTTWP